MRLTEGITRDPELLRRWSAQPASGLLGNVLPNTTRWPRAYGNAVAAFSDLAERGLPRVCMLLAYPQGCQVLDCSGLNPLDLAPAALELEMRLGRASPLSVLEGFCTEAAVEGPDPNGVWLAQVALALALGPGFFDLGQYRDETASAVALFLSEYDGRKFQTTLAAFPVFGAELKS